MLLLRVITNSFLYLFIYNLKELAITWTLTLPIFFVVYQSLQAMLVIWNKNNNCKDCCV